jgi:thioester reductase-like protein
MQGEIFLTGATGFIGSSLLHKWLTTRPDVRVNLLVRSRRDESPQVRVERILGEVSPARDASSLGQRVAILEGDISLANFGLKDREYRDLAARTSHIIHCAAAVRFDLPLEEARSINVAGSEGLLALARDCRELDRIDYVGTAYVAGKRKGLIKENDLDLGQEHNNTYERTKLESESLMRRAMSDLPITIHRPSIVICDSTTGRISRYSAFYRMLRTYHLGYLKALPGYPTTLLDIVPMDYVADAIYAIAGSPGTLGKCYHLTAGLTNLTSFEEVSLLAARHFGRPAFTIIPLAHFEAFVSKMTEGLSEKERDLIDEIRIYQPYLAADVRFDNSNTLAFLGPLSITVPKLSGYFGKMAEYVVRLSTT